MAVTQAAFTQATSTGQRNPLAQSSSKLVEMIHSSACIVTAVEINTVHNESTLRACPSCLRVACTVGQSPVRMAGEEAI
jgi:hypothetical protein